MDKKTSRNSGQPESIAIAVLGWIAHEPDVLARFLNLSGLDASQIRLLSGDPAFLTGILDFIMGHEPTLMACCDGTQIKPEAISRAWQQMNGPGSAEFGW